MRFHRLQIVSAFTTGAILGFLPLALLSAIAEEVLPRLFAVSVDQMDNITFVVTFVVAGICGVAAAVPLVKADIHEHRVSHGQCVQCGYLIQGLENAPNVCPECGHPFRRPEPDRW